MKSAVLAFIAITAAAASLPAQGRSGDARDIPPGHRPPPGLCRIWIDGVPPGRQPAPMRCEDAQRRKPANARVIHASDSRGDDRRDRDGRWDRDDDRDDDRRDHDGRWDRDDDRDDDRRNRDKRWDRDDDCRDKDKKKGKAAHRKGKHRQAASVCHDRNRDGWCDWASRESRGEYERRRADTCLDRDRDGRCDDAVRRRSESGSIIGIILGKR